MGEVWHEAHFSWHHSEGIVSVEVVGRKQYLHCTEFSGNGTMREE